MTTRRSFSCRAIGSRVACTMRALLAWFAELARTIFVSDAAGTRTGSASLMGGLSSRERGTAWCTTASARVSSDVPGSGLLGGGIDTLRARSLEERMSSAPRPWLSLEREHAETRRGRPGAIAGAHTG